LRTLQHALGDAASGCSARRVCDRRLRRARGAVGVGASLDEVLAMRFSWIAFLLTACTVGEELELPPPSHSETAGFSCQPETCDTSCAGGELSGDSLVTPVNRDRGLAADWAPADLVKLPKNYKTGAGDLLRLRAATAFIRLADAAYVAGHDLYCGSSYRSFGNQCSLFAGYAGKDGCQEANTYSARAGHSEHQLGTTCDIFMNGDFLAADTPASAWLDAHAWEYGFAQSYPPGTQCYTLYQHEPWHYRYVGLLAAQTLRDAEVELGRRVSTHELVNERLSSDLTPSIDSEAAETTDAVAVLCSKYKVSWCAPGNRLVECGDNPHVVQCSGACISDASPTVPDRCN
jgi:D-alanyl-D-alanine carboxypeptidase